MHHHRTLQRRVLIATGILAALVLIIGVPLVLLDDERLQLAKEMNLVPGAEADHIAGADSGALLIVIPLSTNDPYVATDWLYRAQFIAWPNGEGNEIENLNTHQRAQVPLESIEFSATNDDGSLVLLRGPLVDSPKDGAVTIERESMKVTDLPNADAVPDAPGNWNVPTWEQRDGLCERGSEHSRFVACFTQADGASYLAGDWQLDLQIYGNYEILHPLYRGQGFIPWVGSAENDTVVYLQNELGIVKIDVPDDVLSDAPPGTPFVPLASPTN